jgi:hypothetical protein
VSKYHAKDMPKTHPLFLELAAQFRALASDPECTWSRYTHAEDEMLAAGLDDNDEVCVFQTGTITNGDTEGQLEQRRFRVEGFTKDGVHAGFIVSFSLEEKWIETVTAFRVRE